MIVQITKDGPKNFSVLIKGIAEENFGPALVVDLSKVKPPSEGWKGIRLDSAVWVIQEKMGLNLWWGVEGSEEDLVLPMESRNFLRLDEGIPSPRWKEAWDGKMYLTGFKVDERKTFLILLDFDKQ